MAYDTITRENLEEFVDIFYTKARNDAIIGPIFNKRINSEQRWARHKAVVSSFWEFHLTGVHNPSSPPKHKGGMVAAHVDMPPFPRENFSVWLRLFEETLNELYTPEIKTQILTKAKDMAQRLQGVLYEGAEWVRHE